MPDFSRMPRYDIRNDGIGPYAIFYCDSCGREFRSQPDVGGAVAQDVGTAGRRRAASQAAFVRKCCRRQRGWGRSPLQHEDDASPARERMEEDPG